MMVHQLDPLADPRWAAFVARHPHASIFHTPGWLEALRRTYGYEPVAYTTSGPHQELTNGLVFCRVRSALTGHRLVSLPFSDHCEVLVDSPADLECLLAGVKAEAKRTGCRYVELRPRSPLLEDLDLGPHQTFYLHQIDLRPPLAELFRSFAKTGCQQKIQRAQRLPLAYATGRSELMLRQFYGLLLRTRRRHQLPPPPLRWFRNLVTCLGERLTIRTLSTDVPIASMVTLTHGRTVVDKYSGSDERFHRLGGMPLLFWNTIQESKETGLADFDLGRSAPEADGLITFKEGWHARRTSLRYYRLPRATEHAPRPDWATRMAQRIFARLPDRGLIAAGHLLYRHIG